jgi:hypothetical protein
VQSVHAQNGTAATAHDANASSTAGDDNAGIASDSRACCCVTSFAQPATRQIAASGVGGVRTASPQPRQTGAAAPASAPATPKREGAYADLEDIAEMDKKLRQTEDSTYDIIGDDVYKARLGDTNDNYGPGA